MVILRGFARLIILFRRVWRRGSMLLLRPAFRRYGKHFIFDPHDFFSYDHIEVGDYVSIGSGAMFLASDSNIIIGNKVLFGPNVAVIGGNHNTSAIGKFMYDIHEKRAGDDLGVILEDDIWVGTGATILMGVRVSRGAIVAAGALVNKNVLPYTVVGGIPARQLSVRFGDAETIMRHEAALYAPQDRLSVECLQQLFPGN